MEPLSPECRNFQESLLSAIDADDKMRDTSHADACAHCSAILKQADHLEKVLKSHFASSAYEPLPLTQKPWQESPTPGASRFLEFIRQTYDLLLGRRVAWGALCLVGIMILTSFLFRNADRLPNQVTSPPDDPDQILVSLQASRMSIRGEAVQPTEQQNLPLNESIQIHGEFEIALPQEVHLKGNDADFQLGKNTVRQRSGRIVFAVKKTGTPFTVYTPTAVLGVRGTIFEVTVDKTGNTLVAVSEGIVSVKPVDEQHPEILLSQGQSSTVSVSSRVPETTASAPLPPSQIAPPKPSQPSFPMNPLPPSQPPGEEPLPQTPVVDPSDTDSNPVNNLFQPNLPPRPDDSNDESPATFSP